jgi:hypothetical protein
MLVTVGLSRRDVKYMPATIPLPPPLDYKVSEDLREMNTTVEDEHTTYAPFEITESTMGFGQTDTLMTQQFGEFDGDGEPPLSEEEPHSGEEDERHENDADGSREEQED